MTAWRAAARFFAEYFGLTRIGKSSKGKRMALKAKSSDTDESSDDGDSKMKSYVKL